MSFKGAFRAGLLSMLTVFLCSSLTLAGETINFGMAKLIDTSINPYHGTYEQLNPRLFLNSNGIHKTVNAVWLEDSDASGYTCHIALSTSSDLGHTWSDKTTVLQQNDPNNSSWPCYAADMDSSGNIYVAVSNVSQGGGFWYAIYSDGQWSEGPLVDTSIVYQDLHLVIGYDDIPYLMACDGSVETFYKYVGGSNPWQQTGQVSIPNLWNADFCMDNSGNIYLFYSDSALLRYRISSDGGQNWSGPNDLDQIPPGEQWYFTGLETNVGPAGDIDVAWTRWSGYKSGDMLFFARHPAGAGLTDFSAPTRVSRPLSESPDSINHERIFYGGPDVYIVWMSEPYWNYGCFEFDFVARSTDGGKSFGRPYRMNWGDYNGECAEHPDTIATTDQQGNTVFVHAWQDDREFIHRQIEGHHMIYSAVGRLYDEDANVLLVDDDYSETPDVWGLDYMKLEASMDYHNYESWHADALLANGIPFDFFDEAGYGRDPGLNYLENYETVIWETGLDYAQGNGFGNDSLTPAQQQLLSDYLARGGKLFLDSQDFLRDVTGGVDGAVYNNFANDYLSVTDVLNFFDHCNTYYGISGDPVGDGLTLKTTDTIQYVNPIAGLYDFNFISNINTKRLTHTADTIFTFNGEPISLRKSENPYSLVFITFPFASIDQWNVDPPDFTDSSRKLVMQRIMGWLDTSQGWRLSKDNNGLTNDSYYESTDWLYIFAWSDRVDAGNIVSAEAELVKPDNSLITVPLTYGSQSGRFKGSLKLKNEPAGTWKVNRITLLDAQGNSYEVGDRYFDLSRSVETVGLNSRWAPTASPYSIGVKVTDASRMEGDWIVRAYYYDLNDPDYVPVLFDTAYVQVSTVDGVGTGSVSLDFTGPDFDYGKDYGIYLELTDGVTTVAQSYSTGSISMLDTVFAQYPGYSNLAYARYGDPGQDYDGDGNSNYKESLAGTDPGDPQSYSNPVATIVYPANGYVSGTTCTVTGTADDSTGKTITAVEVYNEDTRSWETVSGTTNWSYDITLPPSGSVWISVRAVNDIGYVGTATDRYLNIDNASPASVITDPLDGQYISDASYTIKGSSSDGDPYSMELVEVSTDGGASWSPATNLKSAYMLWSSWEYVWTPASDGVYNLVSRGTDKAGNIETPGPGINVTVDTTGPTSAVADPADGAAVKGSVYTISGTSDDHGGSNVAYVEISTDGGVSWYQLPEGTTSWSYDWSLPADGTYTLVCRATDNLGNAGAQSAGVTVTVDNTAPTGSIAIAGGAAYTPSSWVTLNLSMGDEGSGEKDMRFSNDGTNWSAWEPFSLTKLWALDAGTDGIKTAYAEFSDVAGNVSPVYSDTIVLDATVPVSAITGPADGAVLSGAVYTVTGTSGDGAGTGVTMVRVWVDGAWRDATDTSGNGTWTTWSYDWTLPADGAYSMTSSATDAAGNAEEGVFINVTVNNSFEIYRASVDCEGTQADGPSIEPAMSADGRYVVFQSGAGNLDNFGALDTNGLDDIYVVDKLMSVTKRVSEDPSGNDGDGASTDPAISADGRYVVFVSDADNLVAGDTNGKKDIFVHDMTTGVTERVSVDNEGAEADGDSYAPSISADGRYVAFYTSATNLDNFGALDTNGLDDIYVVDTIMHSIKRISEDPSGNDGDGMSNYPVISADGRYVAFASQSDNLVVGDTNAAMDIFLYDMTTGATERVSVDDEGAQADGDSLFPSISSDGSRIAFHSHATNLDSHGYPDTNGLEDVYVVDRLMSVTKRISEDPAGGDGNSMSVAPSISGDGRYVAFISMADNLVSGDTNGVADVFVRDLVSGVTARASINAQHVGADNECFTLAISQDGRHVAFGSNAANLVPGDTNATFDIFVAANPVYAAP